MYIQPTVYRLLRKNLCGERACFGTASTLLLYATRLQNIHAALLSTGHGAARDLQRKVCADAEHEGP
eukprot:2511915-Amphidinium_carterae.1